MAQYVEQQHTQCLLRDKNAEGLATIGNATEAIEIYAQQGDWDRVHKLAEQAGPQAVSKYAIRCLLLPVSMYCLLVLLTYHTRSLTQPLTNSLTHSLRHSLTHSLTHSSVHVLKNALTPPGLQHSPAATNGVTTPPPPPPFGTTCCNFCGLHSGTPRKRHSRAR